jgi:hypothetical protein
LALPGGIFLYLQFKFNPEKMTFIKTITLIFVLAPLRFFAQSDTLEQPELTTTNVSCFYVIDKIWTDKTTAYKRDPYGAVNFVEIENGRATVLASSSKVKFAFDGTVDSLETCLMDGVNTLRLHARSYNKKSLYSAYVFEISQRDEQVLVRSYPKRILTDYYFEVHDATTAEIAEIRKYILENTPKY